MMGLLRKDLLILKSYWKTYAMLLALYAIFAFWGNPSFFTTILSVMLFVLPLSSFSADELARWDRFAVALPVGRRGIVQAKYLFLLVVCAAAFILSVIIVLLATLTGRAGEDSLSGLLLACATCAILGLILNAILYPILFRYGTQKSRIVMSAIFGAVFAAIAIGMGIFNLSGINITSIFYLPIPLLILLLAAITSAVLLLSYHISCGIFIRREF